MEEEEIGDDGAHDDDNIRSLCANSEYHGTLVSVKMDQLKSRDDIQSKFVLGFITKVYKHTLIYSHSDFVLVFITQGSFC